jgi:hypothetical protein
MAVVHAFFLHLVCRFRCGHEVVDEMEAGCVE